MHRILAPASDAAIRPPPLLPRRSSPHGKRAARRRWPERLPAPVAGPFLLDKGSATQGSIGLLPLSTCVSHPCYARCRLLHFLLKAPPHTHTPPPSSSGFSVVCTPRRAASCLAPPAGEAWPTTSPRVGRRAAGARDPLGTAMARLVTAPGATRMGSRGPLPSAGTDPAASGTMGTPGRTAPRGPRPAPALGLARGAGATTARGPQDGCLARGAIACCVSCP